MKKISQILLFFGVWELIVIIFGISNFILPQPSAIFKAMLINHKLLLWHTTITLIEALSGLVLATIISVFLAIIIDLKPKRERYIVPYFAVYQTIPLIVIAPLMLLWFGFGMSAKIILVVLLCIYPILINLIKGFKHVDQEIVDFFQVINGTKHDLYYHVKLPTVLPYFFAGLKLAATYAISGAMFAEYVGAKSGLGIYLSRVLTNFNYELIFAIVIIVSGLTLVLLQVINVIEQNVLKQYGLQLEEEQDDIN